MEESNSVNVSLTLNLMAHTQQGLSAKDNSVSAKREAKRVRSRKRRRDDHDSCSTKKVRIVISNTEQSC